jgi:hypothetical protein
MAAHKFRIGQSVELIPVLPARYSPSGDYKIVRHLPDEDGEPYYRVKSAQEPHERVVKESLLRRVNAQARF